MLPLCFVSFKTPNCVRLPDLTRSLAALENDINLRGSNTTLKKELYRIFISNSSLHTQTAHKSKFKPVKSQNQRENQNKARDKSLC